MYIVTCVKRWKKDYVINVQNIGVFDSKDKAEKYLKELCFKEVNKQIHSDEWIWKSFDKEQGDDFWAVIQEFKLNKGIADNSNILLSLQGLDYDF